MTDADVAAAHLKLHKLKIYRDYGLPLLRAIDQLGGVAKRKAAFERLRVIVADQVNDEVFDALLSRGRFGWTGYVLANQLGLLNVEGQTWTLTDLGRRYLSEHSTDVVVIPESSLMAAGTRDEEQREPTRPVAVTSFRAYEIPVLEALAAGVGKPREIEDFVGERLKASLLPGDKLTMPSGLHVWRFRVAWTRSNLGRSGHASNASGLWQLTDSGRQRLEAERPSWRWDKFPPSTANVLEGAEQATSTAEAPNGFKPQADRWAQLAKLLDENVIADLQRKLRPDLGPSPASAIARNVILYGPPGTGKTHVTKLVARALTGDDDGGSEGQFRLVQFHPSYAYEDFVQGLRPDLTKTELRYALSRGPFLKIAEDAENDPEHFYVLVIDEVNRGDPARIFGELLYALEYRDEPVTLALGGNLSVPSNLVIIGTMNSVDRSVALVDYALRRRFGFIRLDPDESVIETVWGDTLLGNAGGAVLHRFNEWLTQRLDREHVLGHSFFVSKNLDPNAASTFQALWSLDVKPMLEEYFFGDADGLKEAAARWKAIVDEAVKEAESDA